MHRAGWALFFAALGVVAVYVLFAWWYSTLTPTVRVSGEEGWRRAVLFDTTAAPSYPKFIALLTRTNRECPECAQNWLEVPVEVPIQFVGTAVGLEHLDEGIWRNELVQQVEESSSPDDAKWQLGAWLVRDAKSTLDALRPLTRETPFGLVPQRGWSERDARFFGVAPFQADAVDTSVDPWSGAMAFFGLPSRDFLLEVARILTLDARFAAHEGDGRRAVASLIAAMEAADRSLEPGTMFAQATAAGIRARVWKRVAEVLRANPESFDDALLDELERLIAWVGDGPIPVETRAIRVEVADDIQRSFTDNGAGDGWPLADSVLVALDDSMMGLGPAAYERDPVSFLLGPLIACFMPSRADFTARVDAAFDKIDAESKKPLWERARATPTPSLISAPGDYLVEQITGVYAEMANREAFGAPDREAARIALAAERFRRAEGRMPTSLDELVPRFLREIPRNATTGKPITSLVPTP
ncbi:MAG: hypothetical protein RIR10_1262 [Planctomycetota bacterium]